MEYIILLAAGWFVLGALVHLYEVGWSLVYLARYPFDLLAALLAMALGIYVCWTLGWI